MTYENAFYHTLMLQLGLPGDFDAEFDKMLEEEDPLSDLALALVDCGGDRGKQLDVLKEYLYPVVPGQIDDQAVARLILDRFRALFEEAPGRLVQIAKWMDEAAMLSGCYPDGLWAEMVKPHDYYDLAVEGIYSMGVFVKSFLQLLYRTKR